MAERNPNLISPKAMEAMASTAGAGRELISEIFTKINNAKDKPKKIEVLRKYDTPGMRMILKGAFDPKIEWELPEGTPPYIENEAPAGTEHTFLEVEARRLYNFAKGGNNTINKIRKETLFIQMLEGLHASEAKVLIDVKNKSLNKTYKGLTSDMVKEAFGWNTDFVKP
jgi:hypothetical protein|tara:strand:- start:161 stop:667 length:507 start_codon:yes stop_codon:yes gene_type:complete